MLSLIPDLDTWRAANLLIRQHGAEAEIFAAHRADLMLDRYGEVVWMRIRRAVAEPAGLAH